MTNDPVPRGGDDELPAFQQAMAGDQPPATGPEAMPEHIGPYRILEEVGSGGMGTVYKAERRGAVRQLVALKVVRRGLATRQVLARFALERRALAAMNHRSIAKVLDAGETADGAPYFVMEYVEGKPIHEYCDRNKLSLRERLELFQQVCRGVQHAHLKGIVHRDLKPQNVLVVREGDQVVPKILDFGLAKATNRDLLDMTVLTEKDQIMGTPEYMSPEQASGDGEMIDGLSDVYSLGVMLYEILAGELPFTRGELQRAGALGRYALIREKEPPKPSTRLDVLPEVAAECAGRRRTTVMALRRELRGDLDWVVLKAMAKEPARRYQSANGLAEELKRYLDLEPVLAGPPSFGYRARKMLRKYRVQAIAATAVFLTLVAGIVVSWRYAAIAEANAAIVAEQNDRFRLLRVGLHLQRAKARYAELILRPAWPETIPDLEAWLDGDAKAILDIEPDIVAALKVLRPEGADVADQYLHDWLAGLLADIGAFENDALVHVRHLLTWARYLKGLDQNPAYVAAWKAASAALGLKIQIGLWPIGQNPATSMWEFQDLRSAWDADSGMRPEQIRVAAMRDYDGQGRLAVGDGTGIVFVYVPGCEFWMGADPPDEHNGRNKDPASIAQEQPAHRVALEAFFIARHEMTQGQWMRLSRQGNPSCFSPANDGIYGTPVTFTLAHPVEQVTWVECRRVLGSHGMSLPSEAQWECACRSTTTTPWWTGAERESLLEGGPAANLADAAATRVKATWQEIEQWPEYDDGYAFTAPVDSLRANPWGLHHVHGNVWEWCEDQFASYSGSEEERAQGRSLRGGDHRRAFTSARSSIRAEAKPETSANVWGVRAARHVQH